MGTFAFDLLLELKLTDLGWVHLTPIQRLNDQLLLGEREI